MNSSAFRLVIFLAIMVAAVFVLQYFLKSQVQNQDNPTSSPKSLSTLVEGLVKQEAQQNSANSQPTQLQSQQTQNNSQVKKLYKWKDEQGKTQFGENPPEGAQYSEISYQADSPTQANRTKQKLQFNFPSQNQKTAQAKEQAQNEVEPARLSPQCRSKLGSLRNFERKLDKSKDIVGSIWLESYCTALSELIQEGCVMPKSDIKYNRYCPVRYK